MTKYVLTTKTNPANTQKLLVDGNTYIVPKPWGRLKEVVARTLFIKTHQHRGITYKSLGMGMCFYRQQNFCPGIA